MSPTKHLFPALLKHWRRSQGLSQLDLALTAEVSARHLSFLETGRSQAGRDVILRIGAALNIPLRSQNELLLAAGLAAHFPSMSLDNLEPPIEAALQHMLSAHEPFPLLVMNRHYDILRANTACLILLRKFCAEPPDDMTGLNSMRLLFDHKHLRRFVRDWETVARELLSRLHRESMADPSDDRLASLVNELLTYPNVPNEWRHPDLSLANRPVFNIWWVRETEKVGFLTTLTSLSAPQDVTLQDIRIESFYPLDTATRDHCQRWADTG